MIYLQTPLATEASKIACLTWVLSLSWESGWVYTKQRVTKMVALSPRRVPVTKYPTGFLGIHLSCPASLTNSFIAWFYLELLKLSSWLISDQVKNCLWLVLQCHHFRISSSYVSFIFIWAPYGVLILPPGLFLPCEFVQRNLTLFTILSLSKLTFTVKMVTIIKAWMSLKIICLGREML